MTLPENLSRAELAARQLTRLRTLAEELVTSNPFWGPRLIAAGCAAERLESLEDWRRLPTLRKGELVEDQRRRPPFGTNLTQPSAAYTRLHQTSGTTTGEPLRWLDTPRNWSGMLECWQQIYRLMPLAVDHRAIFPFSFGPFLGFWAGFEGLLATGRFAVAGGGMSSEARLKLIRDLGLNLLACTPTYALRLIDVAESHGAPLRELGVRTILVAGEPGGNIPATRDRIATAWGADVVDHWGMTEVGPLGIAAEATRGQLTILETECLAEILAVDTDEPVPPGELGELVITTFFRVDSPVCRYRTGDLVRAATYPDPAGRSLLRLDGGILGRVDDMLIIRGNNLFPSSLEGVVREFPELVEFRIHVTEHRAMSELRLDVEPRADLPEASIAQVVEQLGRRIKDRWNFQAVVTAVAPGTLPRSEMKSRRIVRD